MPRLAALGALLLCAGAAHANTWQREFFSPMSNELPPTRGAVVDDMGHLHFQAFNRQPYATEHTMVHQYTIAADGNVPWMWGLSQANGISDCGVFARGGQRMDCVRRNDWNGEYQLLEMRARHGSHVLWQAPLPAEFVLRDASIPSENTALVVAELDVTGQRELLVLRIENGWVNALSTTPACPQWGQTLEVSRFHMPADGNGRIRHAKGCRNSFGTLELTLEEFDADQRLWSSLSNLPLSFDTGIEHLAFGPDGSAFALASDHGGRTLWTTGNPAQQWSPRWFGFDGRIASFQAGARGLVVAGYSTPAPSAGMDPGLPGPDTVGWFDADMHFWPDWQYELAMAHFTPLGFGLSVEGELLFAGRIGPAPSHHMVNAIRRSGMMQQLGILPLAPEETATGTTYLLATPGSGQANSGVAVARTIRRPGYFGDDEIGLRVDHVPLPAAP